MVNKRFLDFAQRHKSQENPQGQRDFPNPEAYSMSKENYYDNLRNRDETHPDRVENALDSIRAVYRNLRRSYGSEGLVVVAVGSSLVHSAYKDIDMVLLGIQNEDFRGELFDKANNRINGSKPNKPNQNTQFYTGNVGPSWPAGPSSSDFLKPQDYLIDLIVDETGRTFEDWHRMMVSSNQIYCILDRDVEKSSKEYGGKNAKS